jgi:hypothetical protein
MGKSSRSLEDHHGHIRLRKVFRGVQDFQASEFFSEKLTSGLKTRETLRKMMA